MSLKEKKEKETQAWVGRRFESRKMRILQWLLKRFGATKVGSFDGKDFQFNVFLTRPDRANWPPVCSKLKYYLLKPLCKINNRMILKRHKNSAPEQPIGLRAERIAEVINLI